MTAIYPFPVYASEVASHAMSLWPTKTVFEMSNF